ncbi:MAG: hypothetical protein GX672_09220 [Synergistaceae bacterium]|nr:hypothetical protein [Synergistaceae bacterium]
MSETILTMFDKQNPCWTEKLLKLAGEDTSGLDGLVSSGTLEFSEGIYSLTEAGKTEFERLKTELFLEGAPGSKPSDPNRSVKRTKLRMLLDNAHLQRWGIKVYHAGQDLVFYPDLKEKELLSLQNGTLEWSYTDSPLYKKINEEFKPALIEGRRTDLVTPERLKSWCSDNSMDPARLNIDLLYLCHYDFMQYRDFSGHPNDQLKVINTDRFLFVFPEPEIEKNLETVARFHLWLNTLRRMMIPGYVDRDTQEQDSVSWLIFTTEREDTAKALAEELAKFKEKLIEKANPCEIWTVSMEAIENVTDKRELIWELLPDIAHAAQRTII